MKKIIFFIFVLLLTVPSLGIINELDSETADRDLTSSVDVLSHTPSASDPILCQVYITFGDGSKNLDGTGGAFEFVMLIGGVTVQPSPEIAIFGTDARASVWTSQFLVPALTGVIIRVKSPNGADTDVGVTAYLYDVFPVNVAAGVVESTVTSMANNVITTASINDGAITDAKVANDVQVDVVTIETVDATDYIESRTLAIADYFLFGSDDVTLADGPHGGSGAVLTLKSMTVSNPDGDGVTFESTYGDDASGFVVTGTFSGAGMLATGGADEGAGIKAVGGAGGDGIGLHGVGTGTGSGFQAEGGNSGGAGIFAQGGISDGTGMVVQGGTADGAGMQIIGINEAHALLATTGSGSGIRVRGGIGIDAAEIDSLLNRTALILLDGDSIIDKISAIMSKAYTLLTAVGAYDPATDSLEAQQENPQAPPIID